MIYKRETLQHDIWSQILGFLMRYHRGFSIVMELEKD